MTAPAGQVDPFAAVPITGGATAPGARHLEGRTVIIRPIRVDETALGIDKKTPAPTLHADIIVVDGGPIEFGDQRDNSGTILRPASHRVDTPCMFRGWLDSHMYIVNPCRDLLRTGQPVTVGIIERGDQGNRPYFLTETHTTLNRQPRPASFGADARRQNAINLFNAFQTGQWSPPTPVELNPVAAAAFTALAAPAQGWGTSAAAAPVANPAAAPWGQPAPAQQPSSAPQTVGPDLSRPVPGFESMWSGMSEQQRAQLWAAQPASAPAAASAAAPAATPWG